MLKNYLKVAWKVLLRRKVFTFISLFGISVTLMVLTVATAMLDHVFGPMAPETRLDRTLGIFRLSMHGPEATMTSTPGYGFLDQYVRTLPDVETVSICTMPSVVISYLDGRRIESYLKRTDGQFWQILDFEWLEGGPYTPADEASGNRVAVINEATRQRFFGGQPAVGKTLEADGQSFRVVGVVRNVPIVRLVPFADVWVPISTAKSSSYRHEILGWFLGIILARSREDLPAIRAELDRRIREVQLPDPKTFTSLTGGAETFFETVSREIFGDHRTDQGNYPGRLLAALIVLAVLFMLLPTVNLVNLNLSRILERSSEIGVRKAFGASSWTLVGQFVVENLVLTLLGGLLGLVLSWLALHAINASGLIPYSEFGLQPRVFLYGLGAAIFFSLMSGAVPAWKMSRLHPVAALNGRSL